MSPPHAKNNTLNSRPRQPTLHIPLSLYPTLFLVRISRVVTRTRWEYHLLLLINQRKPSRQPTPNMNTEKYVLVRKNNPVKRIHDPIHEKEAKNTVSNKGGSYHPRMEKPHFNESNVKNAPLRSHSCQKGYICREKTPPQATRTTLNPPRHNRRLKGPKGKDD